MAEAEGTEDKTETPAAIPDTGGTLESPKLDTKEAEDLSGDEDEGKEPGGSDGPAVYQRKLYRENKQLKDKIQAQEVETARKDERLKVVEEQKTTTKKEERIFTVTEIEQAVTDDRITRADAERYKSEVLQPRQFNEVLDKRDRERDERDKREKPLNRAKGEISEYVQLIPSLTSDGDAKANQVFQRYNELIKDYDLPENEVTKVAALRDVVGSLDTLRKQSEVRNLTRNGTATHAETGAGGTDNKVNEDALKKVPKDMIDHWEKQGCSPEQIKTYAGKHLEKMNMRRSRYA